jgi:hypothetical protein
MTIRRLLTAITTTALLTGAMLGSPKATSAGAAYNAIGVDPNEVFMENLNDLADGDFFVSALTGSTHQITSITEGSLSCDGHCNDEGFFIAEGTLGWNVTYDGEDMYEYYTEDTLTETELDPGLNVNVWNMKDWEFDFYGSWAPWDTGVLLSQYSSICTNSAHVANVDGLGFLEDNNCQLESDYTTDRDESFGDVTAQFTGYITSPSSGTVEFCAYTDDGFHLEIDGDTVINDWDQQGAENCNALGDFTFVAGVTLPIELWWFENWGGQDIALKYSSEGGYVPVPASWFTRVPRSGANCGDLDESVCPTITESDTNRVVGAPGTEQMGRRATYTWLRCASEGDALMSRRAPRDCRAVRTIRRSTGNIMAHRPLLITRSTRRWSYLRLGVTIGHTTYYSGTYDLNQ